MIGTVQTLCALVLLVVAVGLFGRVLWHVLKDEKHVKR